MAQKLSEREIQKRLMKLRNYERLYPELKHKYERAKEKIKQQEDKIVMLTHQLETALLRIEELERMVFGDRPKDQSEGDSASFSPSKPEPKPKKQRNKDSYQRKIPDQVNEEVFYPMENCPDCHSPFMQKQIHEQYTEDIPLPSLEDKTTTHVIKELIEKGYCPSCKKWKRAKEIQPQRVVLGKKIKTLICFSTYVLNLSISQVRSLLVGLYQFPISNGE